MVVSPILVRQRVAWLPRQASPPLQCPKEGFRLAITRLSLLASRWQNFPGIAVGDPESRGQRTLGAKMRNASDQPKRCKYVRTTKQKGCILSVVRVRDIQCVL
jgi:hypothetical protein